MKDTSGPAFPAVVRGEPVGKNQKPLQRFEGMTLRDYFAAKAMQACIPSRRKQFDSENEEMEDWECFFEIIANESYCIADAMLEARK
jgi:hypothetical protein